MHGLVPVCKAGGGQEQGLFGHKAIKAHVMWGLHEAFTAQPADLSRDFEDKTWSAGGERPNGPDTRTPRIAVTAG